MGIRQLSRVIADNAPRATSEHAIKEYFGRKVAIDASMSIYQFLIAVRTADSGQTLTNADGETTSHLMGLFYRTMRMLEQGIKPVYVFDGRPPEEKSKELAKRGERRQESEKGHAEAHEAGDQAAIEKFAKRTVKVTPKHNEECQQLLSLMGVPFIQVRFVVCIHNLINGRHRERRKHSAPTWPRGDWFTASAQKTWTLSPLGRPFYCAT